MKFYKYPENTPREFELLAVWDDKGDSAGHRNTSHGNIIVWDGHRFTGDLAHSVMCDLNNIVKFGYWSELYEY